MAAIEFSFTGFMPWGKEKSNPSKELVEELREKLSTENIRVLYTKVLPVSARASTLALHNLHTALRLRKTEYPEFQQVLIHIGLNSDSSYISMERSGKNLAKIKGEVEGKIVSEFSDEHRMVTTLKIPVTLGNRIHDSDDAGNYVCNYTYYLSLLNGMQSGVHCLFLHIPHFERMPKLEQIKSLALITKMIEAQFQKEVAGRG